MDEINTNVTETTGVEPKADEPKAETKTAEEMYAELLAENKRMKKAFDKASGIQTSIVVIENGITIQNSGYQGM